MEYLCIEAAIKMQQRFDENPKYITERMNEVHKKELAEVRDALAPFADASGGAMAVQKVALEAREIELQALLDYYDKLQEWDAASKAKEEADTAARKIDPLHGYQVEMGDLPDHNEPVACVIVVEDTLFRKTCRGIYRPHEAEGKSRSYCEDAVADRLGELEVEWWQEQDGRAHESQAFSSTIAMVGPDVETAKKRLGELFAEDPDRWLNLCGWPRFTIYERAPRAPF
jgi:hypothetical protein